MEMTYANPDVHKLHRAARFVIGRDPDYAQCSKDSLHDPGISHTDRMETHVSYDFCSPTYRQ